MERKLLFLIFLLLITFSVSANNTVLVVQGYVHDADYNPIEGHRLQILVDGDTTIHHDDVVTDSNGYYCDSLITPDQDGIILIYTWDSNNRYYEEIMSFDGHSQIQLNIQLNRLMSDQCEANYYFVKDSLNNMRYSFFDNTTASSSIISYQWDFGDNNTSSLQNPDHLYSTEGNYLVNLQVTTSNGCQSSYQDTVKVSIDSVDCQANFYYQKDTATGLMNYYFFFNNSNPADDIVSYEWDFGDGVTSTQENPDHQFQQQGVYIVTLTITTSSGCTSTYTHRIVIEQDILSTCYASFGYITDTTNNKLQCQFFDLSSSYGSPITHYYWDFGDGNQSLQQNPTHTFPAKGVYTVSLTIMTQDSCISSNQTCVTVGNPDFYFLGGQVFNNSMPIDSFDVILFREINSYLQPVDTSSFDTLGYFYFIDIAEGNYKVKIFPGTSNTITTAPTYYQKEILWDRAQSIQLHQHVFDADVDLMSLYPASGPGQINGLMYYDTASATLSFPPGQQPLMQDKEVYLRNKNSGQILQYTTTISNGSFVLDGLPYGTYDLIADYPGKYSSPVTVHITQNNTQIDSVFLKVTEDDVTGIVIDQQDNISRIDDVYPNPTEGKIYQKIAMVSPGRVEIRLQTITGQTLVKKDVRFSAETKTIPIDVSHYSRGVYLLNVQIPEQQINKRQKVIVY